MAFMRDKGRIVDPVGQEIASTKNPYSAPLAPLASDDRQQPDPSEFEVAPFGQRALACLIDAVIGYLVAISTALPLLLGIYLVLGSPSEAQYFKSEAAAASVGVGYCAAFMYFSLLESSSKQATLGKRLLHIKVSDLAGQRISVRRALARNLAKVLTFLTYGAGLLWLPFTRGRQTLHDRLANTLVIRTQSEMPTLEMD
jgi:uncharacterized RDD family membrane protein YckC